MLSLHHHPERYQVTDNLIPTSRGLRSRPGARQLLAGDITDASGWGERLLLEREGRIAVWDGALHDLAPAGTTLAASNFQVLTGLGLREDRLYVADGVNPLWFVADRAGVYARETVSNGVLDADGVPYPLPIATTIATWRNRLWLGFDSNRVRHCEHERPDLWDPLFEQEFQSKEPDTVIALTAHGEMLLAGLGASLWGVTGDSQFNFRRAPVNSLNGAAGPHAMVSDGAAFWAVAGRGGVYAPNLISQDIEEAFAARPFGSQQLLDAERELLWCCVGGRLFVTYLPAPGRWGEIKGAIRGIFQTDSLLGWYGRDGAWALFADDLPDRALSKTQVPVVSKLATWWTQPNSGGSGRAVCNRTRVTTLDASGEVTYRAFADQHSAEFKRTLTGALGAPLRHEFVPRLAGAFFRHELEASGYLQVLDFQPAYRFEARP